MDIMASIEKLERLLKIKRHSSAASSSVARTDEMDELSKKYVLVFAVRSSCKGPTRLSNSSWTRVFKVKFKVDITLDCQTIL